MTAAALATTQIDQQPVKKTRISKRLQEAIRLLMTPECRTQRAAAQKLGMSETYLSEALRKPETRVFIERCARENVAVSQLRASAKLGELLDCGANGTEFDATRLSLAIAGIKPAADAQVSVNIDIKAGYVIDLTDSAREANGNKAVSYIEHDVIK
jgi:DNA-binding Lrp family transcriptional regulator